jgi:uncharacterized protein (DUF2249 family)
MKNKIIYGLLLGAVYFSACRVERRYATPPKEIEQAVKEFFVQHGEQLTVINASKQSDKIYLIEATTLKADGWGLVAQKIQENGDEIWKIDIGTEDKLKELGINPEF